MKNTIIWGFGSTSASHAVNSLEEQKYILIKEWIGTSDNATHDLVDFLTGDICNEEYYDINFDIYYQIFEDSIHKYMDLMSRHSFYEEKSFHELLNIYNMQYNLFNKFLLQNNVELVLFSNIPHEGPDFLLYKISKALEIDTLMFYQSLFANRFFYVHDIDDFGKFENIKQIGNSEYVYLSKKYEKNLFYMSKGHTNDSFLSLKRNSSGHFFKISNVMSSAEYIINTGQNYITRVSKGDNKNGSTTPSSINTSNKKKLLSLNLFKNLLLKSGSHSRRFISRYIDYKRSKKELSNLIYWDVDLKAKFVYFPLHLKPELTTSALGDIYVDQLLAIENLSSILPDDWYIYQRKSQTN